RRVAGDAGARDPAADHQKVDRLRDHRLKRRGPAVVRELRFRRHDVSWPPRVARGRFRPCWSPDGASACEFCEENVMAERNGRRVAVVAGCRTPFCKSGTTLKDARAVDLARYVARELLERTNLDGADVDEVVFGQVVPSALVPNVGREVSLLPQFPKEIPAYSLNRACASAGQAVSNAHDQIALGNANVVIAGGVESLSDIPILASRRFADVLVEASKARSLGGRLRAFSRLRPRDLVPVSPAIAEPSTGETMGQSAEKMAKENHITRAAQDQWAPRSHHRAARLHPVICGRRRRPRLAAAPGPDLRGSQGARARRHRMAGPRTGRGPRGVRGAGTLQPPGLGGQGLGDRPGDHQRDGWVHRDRSPVRRDGGP